MVWRIILILLLSVSAVTFTNCGKKADPENPAVNPAPIDPWDAPVGQLVQGATLFDGWTDLRVLDGPVNVTGGWWKSAYLSFLF